MTTDAAAFVLPHKISFYAEEEDVVVKPSTELIPDEYEHVTDKGVLFHIFRNATYPEKTLAEELLHSVQDIDYSVDNVRNVHEMNNNSQFFKDLEAIKEEAADKSALMLAFIGYCGKQDGTLQMTGEPEIHKTVHIKDIWNMFATNSCPALKYKPKIFIFCTTQKPAVQTDETDFVSPRPTDFDKRYDFPAEADMLIVYKKVEDSYSTHRRSFWNRFCNNITSYSKKYDIVDLISYIDNDDQKSYPVIISTLTRKFYLTPNTEREHFLSVVENHHLVEEALQKIDRDVEKLHEAQQQKKEKKFSFRLDKKSEDKRKVVKSEENVFETSKDSNPKKRKASTESDNEISPRKSQKPARETELLAGSAMQETSKSDYHLGPDYEIKRQRKTAVVKPQKELEQFIERKQLLLAPYEYPRKGNDPGLVLIFNQQSFDDRSYRLGSRRDVNEIITCMGRLGFNVNEKYIFTNYDRDAILRVVNKILSEDLSEVNSLVVFFLTHGDHFNVLHTHDFSIMAHDFWKEFEKCEQLKDKPKMFIFQACKGNSHSTLPHRCGPGMELVPDGTFHSEYMGPDMLVVYSTTEGNVSFRDPKNGTWFIQELCKNFLAYGRRDDAVSLIMRTTKCLCRNYYHQAQDVIKKQMPIFVSTLKKKFYLNRSKDRNVWLKYLQDQERVTGQIKELEKKVNGLLKEKEKRSK